MKTIVRHTQVNRATDCHKIVGRVEPVCNIQQDLMLAGAVRCASRANVCMMEHEITKEFLSFHNKNVDASHRFLSYYFAPVASV